MLSPVTGLSSRADRPSYDLAVARHAVAGADQDEVADWQAAGRHLLGRAVGAQALRRARHQLGQRPDARAGAAGGDVLQQLAQREQQHDHRRLLGRADDGGAERGGTISVSMENGVPARARAMARRPKGTRATSVAAK